MSDVPDIPDMPDVPNVIDSLTSSSATDALSANQGRVLSNKIENLSNNAFPFTNVAYGTRTTNITGRVTVDVGFQIVLLFASYNDLHNKSDYNFGCAIIFEEGHTVNLGETPGSTSCGSIYFYGSEITIKSPADMTYLAFG